MMMIAMQLLAAFVLATAGSTAAAAAIDAAEASGNLAYASPFRALPHLAIPFSHDVDDRRLTAQCNGSESFQHGVASGDPTSDSVVLWTRLSTSQPAETTFAVDWVLAYDAELTNIVTSGTAYTNGSVDNVVKVIAYADSASHYYYGFSACGGAVHSTVGATKTATAAGESLDKWAVAVVSCSNLPYGYFHAYKQIANKASELDAVMHLGESNVPVTSCSSWVPTSLADVCIWSQSHDMVACAWFVASSEAAARYVFLGFLSLPAVCQVLQGACSSQAVLETPPDDAALHQQHQQQLMLFEAIAKAPNAQEGLQHTVASPHMRPPLASHLPSPASHIASVPATHTLPLPTPLPSLRAGDYLSQYAANSQTLQFSSTAYRTCTAHTRLCLADEKGDYLYECTVTSPAFHFAAHAPKSLPPTNFICFAQSLHPASTCWQRQATTSTSMPSLHPKTKRPRAGLCVARLAAMPLSPRQRWSH